MTLGLDDAYSIVSSHILDAGMYFGGAGEMAIGSGQIYRGVRYPVFDDERHVFMTVEGVVYVLTHECDVDGENHRPFNDDIAVVPIIPFDTFVADFLPSIAVDNQMGFLSNMARNNVSRVFYLPPFNGCNHGGIMFLNQISSTKLSALERAGVNLVTSLTEHGRRKLDYMIENHLLRPTQPLPLHRGMVH